jgi:hypothetical protein
MALQVVAFPTPAVLALYDGRLEAGHDLATTGNDAAAASILGDGREREVPAG